MRDLLTVNESTNWSLKANINAKYRALGCHIEKLEDIKDPRYIDVTEKVIDSLEK